jgi:hypothetical protein
LALSDGVVSDSEYKLIVDEVEKYDQLKESIRAKSYAAKDEDVLKKAWMRTEFEKYMQQFHPKV